MIKKFFAALILAVFMFSAQIAAAEDYDWSKAKRIGTKAEFARYIENERRNRNTNNRRQIFHIIFTNLHAFGIYTRADFNSYEFQWVVACREPHLYGTMDEANGTAQVTFEITEYPGTRVANVYLSKYSSDIAWKNLDNDERTLYSEALKIVNEANRYSSEEEKSRHIYNRIREIAQYKSSTNPDAVGALVKKETNCDGFTDAFYMLGRMCNLDVGRIYGTAIDGYGQWSGHAWNWITFSDGKSYCIDVTHGIFKATYENIKNNHRCEWEIIPNLQ